MIKAIFFDFDGVLTLDKSGSYTTSKNIHKTTGIEIDKILSCYKKYNNDLSLGKIKHKDIWNSFCQCLEEKIDIKILKEAFLETPINKDMFELAKNLKNRYKIGIITDNNKERFDLLKKKLKLDKTFDSLILSADIGGKKDEKHIFEIALKSVNLKPEECVFIDNTLKNLKVPDKMGFKTIFYDQDKNDISILLNELNKIRN